MVVSIKNFLNRYGYEVVTGLVAFLASSVLFLSTSLRYPNDDQFILYRYIDNIAAGRGFVYNLGERVLGSTTPLFTLLGAIARWFMSAVPISTPTLLAWMNIVFLSVATVFFYKVSRVFVSQHIALLATLITILNLSRTIVEGMETPLFILTVFAFLHYLFQKKYYRSSIFLSLTLLTRPDAALIAVLAAIYWWQKTNWRMTIRLITISIAVALPWLIFATFYFGSFIPQSLVTKTHTADIYHLPRLQALKVQASHLSRIYWGRIINPDFIPLQIVLNLLPFLGLVYLGIRRKIKADTWILCAIPFAYIISFSISNPIIFPWYLSQIEPFWILLSCMGIVVILEKIQNIYFKTTIIALIVIGPLIGWALLTTSDNEGSKIPYFSIGSYIKTHMNQNGQDTIGIADIGIVGYTTGAPIIDFIGLVNNQSVAFYPIKDGCFPKEQFYATPSTLIEATTPDWLVAGPAYLESCFLMSDWFKDHYTLEYQNETAHVWKLKK